VNASTGEAARHAVRADFTVTFGCLKVGHVMNPGRRRCGSVRVVDIGFSPSVMDAMVPFAHSLTLGEAAEKLPERPFDAHKNSAGRVFAITGSVGMTGAATLVSLAALRAGAGLVRTGCPESLNDILEVKLTEAMTIPLPEVGKKRCLSLRALGRIREIAANADTVALGPGLGTFYETSELVRRFLAGYKGKVVLDADGLNAFKGLRDELAKTPGPAVLTPHAGELSRLMDVPAVDIDADPVAAARDAALALGRVVLLKGPSTVIADPSGTVWINATGNEILATAGSGDVLTGIISGLAAQGLEMLDAAVLGACVHGICGDIAAQVYHGRGALAGDLVEFLPEAFFHIAAAK
jgi:NAD(P)H-hydrate epimerase